MDVTNSVVKTPEAESVTAGVKQPTFTNGLLKRHAPMHHPIVVTYRECLKNHAAAIGGNAVDGCGEFMPSPNSNPAEPTTLKCAACGCHRNFHRREPDELLPPPALEYQPHNRHHPPPPRDSSPNNSPSPPPISSTYYPSAPQMLMALSHGLSGAPPDAAGIPISPPVLTSGNRKRFRTKFTQNQKERMLELAEKISWRLQKKDEDEIAEFLNDIGVDRGVFKVWMHNNKSTAVNKDTPPSSTNGIAAEYNTSDADGQLIHPTESTTPQAHGTTNVSSSSA